MSSKYEPAVTVVMNTCNRGAFIGDTLRGLQQQTYTNFEVVLVNGPSIDDTEEVVKQFNIRYYTAPFNISISRNVGIKHAAGDILAFIDDDAVPEPEWLEQIVAAYKDPNVAAVGGRVYNADGSDFQFEYGAIDRWGYPLTGKEKYDFNDPDGTFFNINIGTNASYRREPLVEVGGFDEEIEYYHDESDVCLRIIEAGYKVEQLHNAYVHHKMAPSFRRKSSANVVNWDAIVKNTIYFGLLHTKGHKPFHKRLLRPYWTESHKLRSPMASMMKGDLSPWQMVVRTFSLIGAFIKGYRRGFSNKRKLMEGYKYEKSKFKPFIRKRELFGENYVLVSQGYPPVATDGIARYSQTIADSLVAQNKRVFVVTKSEDDRDQIEYRNGYWIYKTAQGKYDKQVTAYGRVDNILSNTKGIYRAIEGIAAKTPVRTIFAPLWDVEGLSLVQKPVAPLVTTLMSPLKKVVETQWYWVKDDSIPIVYELEKHVIENSDGVMSISQAVKDTIRDYYDVDWKEYEKTKPAEVIPLAVDNLFLSSGKKTSSTKKDKEVRLLYVGRFERRKGIDLLLDLTPEFLQKHEHVHFDMVGNSEVDYEGGPNPSIAFRKKYKNASWFKRLSIHGYVSEEELESMYDNCDVFVAPSRYESFGLIFIEAMAKGKPVIGTNVGGIPETITDGLNGFLFENEDAKDLEGKLTKLVTDAKLRQKMGAAARQTIEEKFAIDDMAKSILALSDRIHSKK